MTFLLIGGKIVPFSWSCYRTRPRREKRKPETVKYQLESYTYDQTTSKQSTESFFFC